MVSPISNSMQTLGLWFSLSIKKIVYDVSSILAECAIIVQGNSTISRKGKYQPLTAVNYIHLNVSKIITSISFNIFSFEQCNSAIYPTSREMNEE